MAGEVITKPQVLKKLAVVTTHPIQYYAPLFALIAVRGNIGIKVFYTWGERAKGSMYDPGFAKERSWDIPLLNGYEYEFVNNTSKSPGSNHFCGIINPGLINTINQYNPQAILVFGWAFKSHLQAMRYFKGKIPVIFRGDSTLLDERLGWSLKKIFRRFFLKWVYSHIDKAIYVGANNRKYYEAVKLKSLRLVYAPHAIDNTRFLNQDGKYEQQAKEWRVALGIPSENIAVLFAGKFEAKKNPLLIVEAARQLPMMHFIMVGNGLLEANIKEAATELSNVTILPFQNQSMMPVVYRLCDVFVLPSTGPGETWGLAINEAMASGRVVVATNKCGGAVDLIEDGVNGFIIEPTVKSLIDALKLLEKQGSKFMHFKEMSLKKIESFTMEKIADAVETLMENTK